MTSQTDTTALVQRFFDCAERGDVDGLVACYADDAVIWHNTDGLEQTPAQNAETLRGFVAFVSDRRYTQRRVSVFDGGFVQQHVLTGQAKNGAALNLAACVICQVAGGEITRLDEYFDSAALAALRA